MGETQHWRLRSKCRRLSPQEADQLFFPDKGGKSNKAKEFCEDCPVIKECLQAALSGSKVGFQAGTTAKEREQLKSFIEVSTIPDVDKYLPEIYDERSTGKQRRASRNPKYDNKLDDPLYGVRGPNEREELEMLKEPA